MYRIVLYFVFLPFFWSYPTFSPFPRLLSENENRFRMIFTLDVAYCSTISLLRSFFFSSKKPCKLHWTFLAASDPTSKMDSESQFPWALHTKLQKCRCSPNHQIVILNRFVEEGIVTHQDARQQSRIPVPFKNSKQKLTLWEKLHVNCCKAVELLYYNISLKIPLACRRLEKVHSTGLFYTVFYTDWVLYCLIIPLLVVSSLEMGPKLEGSQKTTRGDRQGNNEDIPVPHKRLSFPHVVSLLTVRLYLTSVITAKELFKEGNELALCMPV